ncbi:UbiA family prenyltransferase [Caenispirillum bisanense]|uniref:4-hydroxybenzoate polyprenyltransferase n=1 Tax=Caenispirillum bisanense TaxID=414052 RepID=A0A286GT58_9PROT|nr:UbiA family prenyltransferase [Caenispirillum bisanense]SOD98723.1 4-hydroxybenzoate polyprenyltransferase [Caenispirillum bisanense]
MTSAQTNPAPTVPVPLVVDLDGTLIRSDMLLESFFALLATHPVRALKAAAHVRQGKAALKAALADEAVVDVALLPFDERVVEYLRAEKAAGRPVYLASASDQRLLERFAEHLDFFDGVFGSDRSVNLAGNAKANRLVAEFGRGGFDYIGNDTVDMAVWKTCRRAVVVNASSRLLARLQAEHADLVDLGAPARRPQSYLKALRPHQWIKNTLVFVPLVAGQYLAAMEVVLAVLAFWAFSFAASSAYQLNDLLDLAGDRDHPTKRFRPLASGVVPLLHGSFMVPGLFLAAVILGLFVSYQFLLVLLLYYAITIAYSLHLKRRMMVDVMTLAGLYTLRIVGGIVALQAEPSPWLLGFSLFVFFSLAIVKRYVELIGRLRAEKGPPRGRGYVLEDMSMLAALGAASAFSAVVVLALYLTSAEVNALYDHPEILWVVCPLFMYWISRVLLIAHRGELHDDPVLFAAKDRISLAIGGVIVALVMLAV